LTENPNLRLAVAVGRIIDTRMGDQIGVSCFAAQPPGNMPARRLLGGDIGPIRIDSPGILILDSAIGRTIPQNNSERGGV
jgi:hypothetical protein